MKIFTTLRNHWKKTVFFSSLACYCTHRLIEKITIFKMMKVYCSEAKKCGNFFLEEDDRNRGVTIILNPTAGNRKSKTYLEKYAEPLLHLAGFMVNIVKTERISEARDLAEVVDKTNVLVTAGGDGTLTETLTGLLRREDSDDAVYRLPLGLIPVGDTNEFARSREEFREYNYTKLIAEWTMAIIRHSLKSQGVMEIRPDGKDANGVSLKPVYALNGLSIGAFQECQKRKKEMPRFLGEYFNTFWSHLNAPDHEMKFEIRYKNICEGCRRCASSHSSDTSSSALSRIAYAFIPLLGIRGYQTVSASEFVDNPDCGVWKEICIHSNELNILCQDGALLLELGCSRKGFDIVKEGISRLNGHEKSLCNVMRVQEIILTPISAPETLSIDNEIFDMKTMNIRCLKEKVYFFCPDASTKA